MDAIGIAAVERSSICSAQPKLMGFFPGLPIQICKLTRVKSLDGQSTCLASSLRVLWAAAPSPAEGYATRISSPPHFPYIPAPIASSATGGLHTRRWTWVGHGGQRA